MSTSSSFTDIFIRRPVLATVISLLIFVAGLGSIFKLQLSEYPKMETTTITVSTVYPGANASTVQGFVTTPLEKSIASAEGIDYLEASSTQGTSTITAHITLNFSPNAALSNITGKVNAVLSQLPQGIFSPTIDKETGQTFPNLIMSFSSKKMTTEQITAYIKNVISPQMYAVKGVSQILVWGAKDYAMRIWLNTERMARLGVTPTEVYNALKNNNVQAAPGRLKGKYLFVNLKMATDLHTAKEFNNLVVKDDGGRLIRIRDIGKAELGAQSYDYAVHFNGHPAIFAGINAGPSANPLTVVNGIIKLLPGIHAKLPPGLDMKLVVNNTKYISESIEEVIQTIIEAIIIVILVIFAFLGSARSVLVPVVTIPLSLVGVCFFMYVMGFSLNLLTLLAFVLAIGLVVDDAIVVLENIYRHLEKGRTAFQAAIHGAREIRNPVIVMTTTLVAVFLPIGFMGGITGALFTEFAWTLAFAVVISGVVALTFSPMLCSKLVNEKVIHAPLVKKVDRFFEKVREFYARRLHGALNVKAVILFIAILVLTSCYFLFTGSKTELAPTEDQGILAVMGSGPSAANLDYLDSFIKPTQKIFDTFPQMESSFNVSGVFPNSYTLFSGMMLKPWSERNKTQMQLAPILQKKISQIAGLQTFVVQFPSLPGIALGPPVLFVLKSTRSPEAVYPIMKNFVSQAKKSGLFLMVDGGLRFDKPQFDITIDRAKAASLGVSMSAIAQSLSVMVGGNLVNYFSKDGYSFQVMPQVWRKLRNNINELQLIQLKTASGKLVPLSTFVKYKRSIQPSALTQFDQLNSATINALPAPGVSIGEAYNYLVALSKAILPKDVTYDTAGSLRQFVQEGDALVYIFMFALIFIYLILAAQFESFRDPFIILVSVPMSICGALVPIYLGASTLNIYTEIGLVTLIGLISKHGILMVEFANKLQLEEGLSVREAIEKSAAIRLRPILMTTFSMVFGVVPLLMATGAGAVSRFDIGLVIAMGMAIGTCFTMFVVPTMYTYLARDHRAHQAEIAAFQKMDEE